MRGHSPLRRGSSAMGGGHRPRPPSPSQADGPGPSSAAGGSSSRAQGPASAARGSPGADPTPAACGSALPSPSASSASSASSPLSWRPPSASLGTRAGEARAPLRRARADGMAAMLLEAGLARLLFYPTLLYTLLRGKMPGRGHRDWYHRIDSTVLLGALPLRSMTRQLVHDENVRGVVTMNEEYETRFLCNSSKEWRRAGVEQLRLSTVDMTGIPTLADLQKGVQFVLRYRSLGQCVYVHCKAGRSRSATMVAAYLIQVNNCSPEEAVRAITKIRSHIHVRPGQLEVLKEFFKITAGLANNKTLHTSET